MTIKIIIPGLLLFLSSCADKEILKQIPYGDKTIFLNVSNGGATTGFYWNISIVGQEHTSKSEDDIFSIYGEPAVKDIAISHDTLKIICYGLGTNNFQTIDVNLNKIDKFIDDPVRYNKAKLKETNEAYQEPEFIKELREFEKANGMY